MHFADLTKKLLLVAIRCVLPGLLPPLSLCKLTPEMIMVQPSNSFVLTVGSSSSSGRSGVLSLFVSGNSRSICTVS